MKKKTLLLALIACLFYSANAFDSKYPFQVKTSGAGAEAIVFIPGFACSGEVWQKTISEFSATHTCYTLTMAGFAGVPARDSCSFVIWEKGIADFIRDNKLSRPVIVGHSMGGGLAMALAADYPDLAGRVVVVDALPCLAALMNPDFKSDPNKDCSPMVKQLTAMSSDAFSEMQKKGMTRLLADSTKRPLVIGWTMASDRKTFAEMYCDFSNTDLRGKIADVKCPVLVLLESYFVNFRPAIENQYSKLKTAELVYAQKGLHFIMYDDTEWYLQQLHHFINS